jgi:HEAT repeat protein
LQAVDQLSELWAHDDDSVRTAAALAGGRALVLLPDDSLMPTLQRSVLAGRGAGEKWTAAHGRTLVLAQVVRLGGERVQSLHGELMGLIKGGLKSEHVPVREAALEGISGMLAFTLGHAPADVPGLLRDVVADVAASLNDSSADVRKAAAGLVKRAAKRQPAAVRPHLNSFVPPLLSRVHDNM